MFRARPTIAVGSEGIYRAMGSLPDINQPDTLSVEKYIGSPFYAYMFLSTKKQSEVRAEAIADLLSKEEAVNYYVDRMTHDLKLQKAAMGATLLRSTYVRFKEMRKFIWQHNNPEKVIARDDHGFLPAFKRMLTRFVLLNYCAMNTPGVSGAEWVPEGRAVKGAFAEVNKAYQREFFYFEWQGENCKLRHPNPLNGHPRVNFSAYTDDMSDGRVFTMDVKKHDLVNEINTVNAQIFELLSKYIGSLSIAPTPEELARDGIHFEVETPAVFESLSAKETRPDVLIDADGDVVSEEALIDEAYRLREVAHGKQLAALQLEYARLAKAYSEALNASNVKSLKGSALEEAKEAAKQLEMAKEQAKEAYLEAGGVLSSSSGQQPEAPRKTPQRPTLAEALGERGAKQESPEFMEQAEGLEGGKAKAAADSYVQALDNAAVMGAIDAAFNGSKINSELIEARIRTLTDALLATKYFREEEKAKLAAMDIIAKGLTAYKRGGKTLKTKSSGFVAFTKRGALSNNGGNKVAKATEMVRKMFARGKFNADAAIDMV